MLDIIESTRMLTSAGLQSDQAAAIAHVVQQAVEQGDHVTPDQFRAGMAEVRTEIASLDKPLNAWTFRKPVYHLRRPARGNPCCRWTSCRP